MASTIPQIVSLYVIVFLSYNRFCKLLPLLARQIDLSVVAACRAGTLKVIGIQG